MEKIIPAYKENLFPLSDVIGKNHGVRGGYKASFRIGNAEYHFHTEFGIRGIDIPCIIEVMPNLEIRISYE